MIKKGPGGFKLVFKLVTAADTVIVSIIDPGLSVKSNVAFWVIARETASCEMDWNPGALAVIL